MTSFETFLQLPWITRLGWTLLHFLWQGTLIALLLAAFRAAVLRRSSASVRYAAGCTAFGIMAVAPVVTFLFLSASSGAPRTALAGALPIPEAWGTAASSLPVANLWDRISPWLGAAWMLGVGLCLIRLFGGWLATRRLRAAQIGPAPAEWRPVLARIAALMKVDRAVRLLASSLVETPVTIGWLRPIILVPAGALAGLPAAHLEALLAHELAHIRRHDYLVNLLQSVAEAMLFYHPAVWWVSAIIRADREYCCDDLAVAAAGGDVLLYSRALAELESCRPVHAAAMAATGGSLRRRIGRLLDPAGAHSHGLPTGAAAWTLAAILVISGAALAVRASASPAPAPPQDSVVNHDSVWTDTAKQGDMTLEVRGLGTLTSASTAEMNAAMLPSKDVVAGQAARIQYRNSKQTTPARVIAIRPSENNVTVPVDLAVLAPLPDGIHIGDPIDALVIVGQVSNVVHIGRPVFATAYSEGTLYKLDPDGQHATPVKVQYGHMSVNQIEVVSGLQPGDRVILSDMSAYAHYERVTIR